MKDNTSFWSNVAFGGLIAVIMGLVLTRDDVTPSNGFYIWLVFVVAIGLSYSADIRTYSTFKAAAYISLVLFITLAFKGAVQTMVVGTYVKVVSVRPIKPEDMMKQENLIRYGLFYLAIFLMTIPGIAMAIYARNIVLSLLSKLFNTAPERMSKIKRVINISIKIVSLVLGAVLAIK